MLITNARYKSTPLDHRSRKRTRHDTTRHDRRRRRRPQHCDTVSLRRAVSPCNYGKWSNSVRARSPLSSTPVVLQFNGVRSRNRIAYRIDVRTHLRARAPFEMALAATVAARASQRNGRINADPLSLFHICSTKELHRA